MKVAARQRDIKYPPGNPAEVRRAVRATNVNEFDKGGLTKQSTSQRPNSSTCPLTTPVEVGPVIGVRDQDCAGWFRRYGSSYSTKKRTYGTVGYGTVG